MPTHTPAEKAKGRKRLTQMEKVKKIVKRGRKRLIS